MFIQGFPLWEKPLNLGLGDQLSHQKSQQFFWVQFHRIDFYFHWTADFSFTWSQVH